MENNNTQPPPPNLKLSICVVTYNQENYLEKCLESIFLQNVDFSYEVIISDDHSTDGTRKIIEKYLKKHPSLVRAIYRNPNIGPYKNFVQTHNLARGEFVAHIDGDDYMLQNKLDTQVKFLDQNPTYNVVWHKMKFVDALDRPIIGNNFNDTGFFDNGVVSFEDALAIGSIASHSSCMYRRSARLTTDPDFDTLDLFYTWEFLSSGLGKILPDYFGAYRLQLVGSISNNSQNHIKKLYAHHALFYSNKFPDLRSSLFVFALVNLLADLKNHRPSARYFFEILKSTFCLSGIKKLKKHFFKSLNFRKPI